MRRIIVWPRWFRKCDYYYDYGLLFSKIKNNNKKQYKARQKQYNTRQSKNKQETSRNNYRKNNTKQDRSNTDYKTNNKLIN